MEIQPIEFGQQFAVQRTALALMRKALLAQRDKRAFVETVGRDDHGDALRLEPLHQQWFRHVDYCWERRLRCMILAHYGSGKTSSLIVPLITWLVGRDPNVRIKVVTNDDAGAAKRVNAAKRIIESDEYRRVWPNVRQGDRWTDHEIYVRRLGSSPEPTVHARGIFTTGIGGRADFLLLDDVCDQKNSTDQAQRKRVLDLCEQTWFSRLEPDGNMLWVCTSWHQQDASHVLMQQKGWCTLVQRVSQDCLQIEQEVLGAYDGQYPTMG
jgi:hypothetical protein